MLAFVNLNRSVSLEDFSSDLTDLTGIIRFNSSQDPLASMLFRCLEARRPGRRVKTCWIDLVSMISAVSATILKTLCNFYKRYWLQKSRQIS